MKKLYTPLFIVLLACLPLGVHANDLTGDGIRQTLKDGIKPKTIQPEAVSTILGAPASTVASATAKPMKTSANLTEDYSWISLGTGQYREDLMTTFYSVENLTYGVEIEEAEETPGLYRLVYPYGEAYPYNEVYIDGTADWDLTETYYMYIDATDPDSVWVYESYQGLDWGYGNILITSYVAYYINYGGYELDYLKSAIPGYFGTLEDGVITMPAKSMLINMPEYSSSYYYSNKNGLFAVALPGYEIKDYTVDFTQSDTFVANDSTSEGIVAQFSFGKDIAFIRYAVTTDASETDTIYQGIVDGTGDYTELSDDSEEVQIAVTEGTDTYYLVIVGYDANGKEQYYEVETFRFTTVLFAETWTEIANGIYDFEADDPYGWGSWGSGSSEASLYQSDSDASHYAVSPWWSADEGLIFTLNDDNSLTIEENWTGTEYGSYGDIYASGLSQYFGSSYSDGHYDESSDTFMFYLVYYVSAGWLTAIGESFTPVEWTGVEAMEAEAASQAKAVGYYTLSGQRVSSPVKGAVTIARMSDGTCKKLLVK